MSDNFRELITHLRNVSAKFSSIPGQLCGLAADAIETLTKCDVGVMREEIRLMDAEMRRMYHELQEYKAKYPDPRTPAWGGHDVTTSTNPAFSPSFPITPGAVYRMPMAGGVGYYDYHTSSGVPSSPQGGGYWIEDPISRHGKKWIPFK